MWAGRSPIRTAALARKTIPARRKRPIRSRRHRALLTHLEDFYDGDHENDVASADIPPGSRYHPGAANVGRHGPRAVCGPEGQPARGLLPDAQRHVDAV